MVTLPRAGRPPLVRALAVPLVAVAVIAALADVRLGLGLPGHRGLLWLPVLVAVALTTRTRGATTAVGMASTVLVAALGVPPVDALRYAAAAVLLDALAAMPLVRRHPLLLALAAAPVHLVALLTPLSRGFLPALALPGHLLFGLVAGLLAYGAVAVARR